MKNSNNENLQMKEPNSASRFWLKRLFVRFSKWLVIHGVSLPWGGWLVSQMSVIEKAQFERELLAYEIKTADYRLSLGPLWLRKFIETVYEKLLSYRFLLSSVLKVLLSALIISLPIALFGVYRLFLPYPEALEEISNSIQMPKEQGRWKVLQAYDVEAVANKDSSDVEGEVGSSLKEPFLHLRRNGFVQELKNDSGLQGEVFRVSDSLMGGPVPTHKTAMLVSEGETRRFVRRKKPEALLKAEVAGENFLGGSLLVLSSNGANLKCRVELKDQKGTYYFLEKNRVPIQIVQPLFFKRALLFSRRPLNCFLNLLLGKLLELQPTLFRVS